MRKCSYDIPSSNSPSHPAGRRAIWNYSGGATHGVLGRRGFAFWRKKSPECTALQATLADSGNCCLDVNFSSMLNFGSKELGQTVSRTRSQQMRVSKTAEAQLRRSDYFVAKDFTNHFNLRTQSIATAQKSELTRTGQGSVSQKRVVVN